MVSLIVPIYNSQDTIKNCVQSIRSQTCEDLEIILVNDGSTDDSLKICQELSEEDSRIKVIDRPNGGVSAARNSGLDAASGEYICFVDSDDLIMPDYVKKLSSMIVENCADLAICGMNNNEPKDVVPAETRVFSSEQLLNLMAEGKITSGIWSIMVPKKLLNENSLRFAEGYKYSEDLHLLWRIVHYCKKIAYTSEKYYIYVDIAGSAMAKFNENRSDSIKLFENLKGFFLNNRSEFAEKFSRLVVSKSYWSFAWQAAVKLPARQYKKLCREYKIKKRFKDLISHPSKKVAFSSAMGIISLSIFRVLAITFGKSHCH